MKKVIQKNLVKGFTSDKKTLVSVVKKLKKEFFSQSIYSDAIKFIADKMEEMDLIDNKSKSEKYTLVNRFIVKVDEIYSLKDDYERFHKTPNPNYSYEYGGSKDLEDLYAS